MIGDKERIHGQLLVLRFQRGDAAAFEELIKVWEKRLFFYLRRLVDQEADAWDVLQKTWVKVMGGLKSLKQSQSLPSWLYTVARNTAIDHQRGLRRIPAHQSLKSAELEEPLCVAEEPELVLDDVEAVHAALGKLSIEHREALTLYFLQDLGLKEIAEVVGTNVGTVKSRLHYARKALRALLQEDT